MSRRAASPIWRTAKGAFGRIERAIRRAPGCSCDLWTPATGSTRSNSTPLCANTNRVVIEVLEPGIR